MRKVLEKMEKSPRKPWKVLEFESVFFGENHDKSYFISNSVILFGSSDWEDFIVEAL